MPSMPVGIVTVDGDGCGESPMRRATLTRRRRPVHRRPHQRMPELEPRAMDEDESGSLGSVERGPAVVESGCRGEDDNEVLRLVRGSDQEETLRLFREPSDALQEDAFDLAGERQRLWKRLVSRELCLRERGWKLD